MKSEVSSPELVHVTNVRFVTTASRIRPTAIGRSVTRRARSAVITIDPTPNKRPSACAARGGSTPKTLHARSSSTTHTKLGYASHGAERRRVQPVPEPEPTLRDGAKRDERVVAREPKAAPHDQVDREGAEEDESLVSSFHTP